MGNNQYLQAILESYRSENLDYYQTQIGMLAHDLKEWADVFLIEVKYSGSCAKGTAISLSSDVDIFISLSHDYIDSGNDLGAMYNSLGNWLVMKNYHDVRAQNVSYRIQLSNLKVDITAGVKRKGNTNFHSLYVSKNKSWIQTAPQMHINDIFNSGRVEEIKLLKVWSVLNNLDFPSIYLEYLTVVELMYRKPLGSENLASNFFHILSELSLNFSNPLNKSVNDPANTNNILSNLIDDTSKLKIRNTAKESVAKSSWDQIIW